MVRVVNSLDTLYISPSGGTAQFSLQKLPLPDVDFANSTVDIEKVLFNGYSCYKQTRPVAPPIEGAGSSDNASDTGTAATSRQYDHCGAISTLNLAALGLQRPSDNRPLLLCASHFCCGGDEPEDDASLSYDDARGPLSSVQPDNIDASSEVLRNLTAFELRPGPMALPGQPPLPQQDGIANASESGRNATTDSDHTDSEAAAAIAKATVASFRQSLLKRSSPLPPPVSGYSRAPERPVPEQSGSNTTTSAEQQDATSMILTIVVPAFVGFVLLSAIVLVIAVSRYRRLAGLRLQSAVQAPGSNDISGVTRRSTLSLAPISRLLSSEGFLASLLNPNFRPSHTAAASTAASVATAAEVQMPESQHDADLHSESAGVVDLNSPRPLHRSGSLPAFLTPNSQAAASINSPRTYQEGAVWNAALHQHHESHYSSPRASQPNALPLAPSHGIGGRSIQKVTGHTSVNVIPIANRTGLDPGGLLAQRQRTADAAQLLAHRLSRHHSLCEMRSKSFEQFEDACRSGESLGSRFDQHNRAADNQRPGIRRVASSPDDVEIGAIRPASRYGTPSKSPVGNIAKNAPLLCESKIEW